MLPRYITKNGIGFTRGCDTYEDLKNYLGSDPYPEYRLVSATFISQNWILVFELKEISSNA